mgnify:CR=1 FL=1
MSIYLGIDVGSKEHALYLLDEEKDDRLKRGRSPTTRTGLRNWKGFCLNMESARRQGSALRQRAPGRAVII